jgi:hypothetical protein
MMKPGIRMGFPLNARGLHNETTKSPPQILNLGKISSHRAMKFVSFPAMIPNEILKVAKPAPETKLVDLDDDFNEPLGERQPEANDAIVCEGGCQ